MFKQKEISDILSLYEDILRIKPINEASNTSTEIFGGDTVVIPADGAHAGQQGWQSNNAWDIKATIGTPVYAVIGGTVKTFKDYGSTPINKDGKTLFGAGFTVDSDENLPDVYYTHLKDVTIKQGDRIECGQLLGYVMDFPGSNYDHLHIGVENGNITQFLNNDGTLKCAKGQSTTQSDTKSDELTTDGTSSSIWSVVGVEKDPFMGKLVQSVGKSLKLKEEKSFGKNTTYNRGTIIIPKDSNTKIKSPVSGIVTLKYTFGCENKLIISLNNNNYLQFCGISSLLVKDGDTVNEGTVLGTTETDVEVTMFDSFHNIIPIKTDNIVPLTKKDDEFENDKKNDSSDNSYPIWDVEGIPKDDFLSSLPSRAVKKVFGNRYDKSGKLIQKRWGGVSDKQQVDPWIIDAIKSPFKSKKVSENIERIKKLL